MEHPMTRNRLMLALVVLCVAMLAGPFGWGQTKAQGMPPATEAPKIAIGPGDILDVEVFDTPELSMQAARVSQSGQVNLPVLGLVEVAGLNQNQAARRIESALRAHGIMLDPHVTVSVVESASQGVTLLGEVKSPGVYPVYGGRRLLDLIALAGGLTPTAGKIVIIAHRDDPHHPVAVRLVPNAMALGSQQNPVILPGDTVEVGKAGIIYILGAVGKPGGYLIDNNEHISLMQALTLAGGWQKEAALSKAMLIRKVPQGHKELMLDLKHVLNGQQADVNVKNGDILYVPTSLGKSLAYRGVEAAIAAAQAAVVYSSVNGG
jgi:polysaccharide biosynthesis/export protein